MIKAKDLYFSYNKDKNFITNLSVEIEKGKIKLVKWEINAQETGSLWVVRKIIGGPTPISSYLQYAKEERIKKRKN